MNLLESSILFDPRVNRWLLVSRVNTWVSVFVALRVAPGDVAQKNLLSVFRVSQGTAGITHARAGVGLNTRIRLGYLENFLLEKNEIFVFSANRMRLAELRARHFPFLAEI